MRGVVVSCLCLLSLVAFSTAGSAQTQPGGDPPSRAYLRLNVEQHTAPIRRVASDRDGKILVTASEDKTLRVWSPDGAPRAVLRVPVDDGWEGQLYALAVSPDGKFALAAGLTGPTWDGGSSSVYVFDIDKGETVGRLAGFPGMIRDVAYSPKGTVIAVTSSLGDRQGSLALYNAADFKPQRKVVDFQGAVTGLAFDEADNLVTVSLDGNLRVFPAPTYEKPRQAKLAGKLPTSVAVTPSGDRIAVGFADRSDVSVFSGDKLQSAKSPSLEDLKGGNPTTVAWVMGEKGPELIAGGTMADAKRRFIVRRWLATGKSVDVPVADDSVTSLTSDGAGGFLFAGADPVWGRVSAAGAVTTTVGRITADFRDAHDGKLAVSQNGLSVIFRLGPNSKELHRFNMAERVLLPLNSLADPSPAGPDRASRKVDPSEDARLLGLDDWRNSRTPTLKKRKLALEAGEIARSVAALPDNKGFVLGSDARLRLYAPTGDVVSTIQLPGTAWSLAAGRDGQYVVAFLGDGSVRWYNVGGSRPVLAEVAAFFPHPDGKRWVAWTPEGFFDHSDNGGGQLVGFHLNDGKRKTRWMDFESAYRVFYASDLVTARLSSANDALIASRVERIGDVRQLIARRPEVRLAEYCLNAAEAGPVRGLERATQPSPDHPPGTAASSKAVPAAAPDRECHTVTEAITIARGMPRSGPVASPDAEKTVASGVLPPGTERVTLRFNVKASDGYGTVRIFRNGGDATEERVTRGLSRVGEGAAAKQGDPSSTGADGDVHEAMIFLDEGENLIDVRIFDKSGMVYGESRRILLNRAKSEALNPGESPRLLLLSAGVNNYSGEIPRLVYARSDASGFNTMMLDHIPAPFDAKASKEAAISLSDDAADKTKILDGLRKLRDMARPVDLVVVYLAGHGTVIPVADGDAVNGYYFLTNGVKRNADADIRAGGISSSEIVQALANLATPNVLLILDTCHAGELAGSEFGKIRKEIGNPSLWAASSSVQQAADGYKDSGQGLFFYGITSALTRGAGTDDENRVFMDDARAFLIRQIPVYAKEINHKQSVVAQSATDIREGNVAIPLYKR